MKETTDTLSKPTRFVYALQSADDLNAVGVNGGFT